MLNILPLALWVFCGHIIIFTIGLALKIWFAIANHGHATT
jgi:hypothetical protein